MTTPARTHFYRLVTFFGLLAIVPLVALGIIRVSEPEIRRNALTNLESIAGLKARLIEEWLVERRIDLEFLASNEMFVQAAEHLMRDGNAESRAFAVRRLEAFTMSKYYHSAVLVNSSGQVLAAAGGHGTPEITHNRQLIEAAFKEGNIHYSELHRNEHSIHLDIVLLLPKKTDCRQRCYSPSMSTAICSP